jgi:hypothetical protein
MMYRDRFDFRFLANVTWHVRTDTMSVGLLYRTKTSYRICRDLMAAQSHIASQAVTGISMLCLAAGGVRCLKGSEANRNPDRPEGFTLYRPSESIHYDRRPVGRSVVE